METMIMCPRCGHPGVVMEQKNQWGVYMYVVHYDIKGPMGGKRKRACYLGPKNFNKVLDQLERLTRYIDMNYSEIAKADAEKIMRIIEELESTAEKLKAKIPSIYSRT